jgi:hypothetical protein
VKRSGFRQGRTINSIRRTNHARACIYLNIIPGASEVSIYHHDRAELINFGTRQTDRKIDCALRPLCILSIHSAILVVIVNTSGRVHRERSLRESQLS